MEIFCNIINLFTVTFDQLNASMLNKSNLKKILHKHTKNISSNIKQQKPF